MGLWLWPWNNGSRLSLHVRRRRGKVGATSRSCWLFFNREGVVHHEYAPPGQTVTKDYYIEVLCRLRDAVRRKWQQLWASGDWHLHYDNAPAHSSALVQTFLVKHRITQVCQLPTAKIWLSATSGFSRNWNCHWKGGDFRPQMTLRRTRRGSWWWFRKRTFQIVLRSGRNARISVWGPKGSTLKGTKVPLF